MSVLARDPAAGGERPSRGASWLAFAALLALVLLANRDVLRAWFGADDFLWLEIGTWDNVLRSFVGAWGHGAAWRPLSRVSFYLDLRLFGLDARPWHLDSLVWHAAGATLLGLLLDRLSGERAVAIVAATIFALLPLHYENTMWISGRSHLLAFTGCAACLLVLTRFLEAPTVARLALCAALLAAALLAYEAAVYALPFAVLVLVARREVASRPAVLGVAAIALVTATYLLLRYEILAGESIYPMVPPGSFLTAGFADKLRQIVAQLLGQLAPSPWWFVAAAPIALWVAPRMTTIAGFGLVVMVVGYVPFAFVEGFGPRFAYASQAGLAMVLAAIVVGLARVRRIGKVAAAALLVTLLLHEYRETRQLAADWRAAGEVGRRTLDLLVGTWHDPNPDRPAVILGAPPSFGRAFVFFTYFDVALGVFHPEYAGLRVPGHVLSELPPDLSRAVLGDDWRREQERRVRHGLPPLVCPRDPNVAPDVDGFLRALLACDAVFYEIEPDSTVRELPRQRVRARITRGWRTMPG